MRGRKLNEKVFGASKGTSMDYKSMLFEIATEFGEFFGSALGNGMSKLVEDLQGNFTVTSDGATLINELYLRYKQPIASLLLEAGDAQGKNHGDLSKGTIVLACNLVLAGLDLLQQGLHPTTVKQGYDTALYVVLDNLGRLKHDSFLEPASIMENMDAFLWQKLSKPVAEHLARITADPLHAFVKRAIEEGSWDKLSIDQLMVKFLDEFVTIIHVGGQITDSCIIDGASISKEPLFWKERWNEGSISRLANLRVALITGELYLDKKKLDRVQISVDSVEAQGQFRTGLDNSWTRRAESLQSMGVDVLVTEKGIDDALVSALQAGPSQVLVFRRAKLEEMKRVARHVRATIANDIDSLEASDLGHADGIRLQPMRKDVIFVFVNGDEPWQHELVITGALYGICDAVKHHVTSAMRVAMRALHGGVIDGYPFVLETISRMARDALHELPGTRSILASDAFLDAMVAVGRRVAMNEGVDYLERHELPSSGVSIPVESIASMMELATTSASRLLGVDGLFINKLGWEKRTGKYTPPENENQQKQEKET